MKYDQQYAYALLEQVIKSDQAFYQVFPKDADCQKKIFHFNIMADNGYVMFGNPADVMKLYEQKVRLTAKGMALWDETERLKADAKAKPVAKKKAAKKRGKKT